MRTVIKISNYCIAETILRTICDKHSTPFVDLDIAYSEHSGIINNVLNISPSVNLGQTLYKIIETYILNWNFIYNHELINNDEKDDILVYVSSLLRNFIYSEDVLFTLRIEEMILQRLYQRAFIWTMMKDLVCPLNDVILKNVRVVVGNSAYIDIARFYEENEIEKGSYSFIFLNMDVENEVVRNVFLLIESIKAHGLCPVKTINNILHSDCKDKFIGLVSIAFVKEDKIQQFFSLLLSALMLSIDVLNEKDGIKQAQTIDGAYTGMWWYLGILERMIQPYRGTNWTTYQSLEPAVKEFWDKVEKVKEKRGGYEPVPFDVLLRLKSDEYKTDISRTYESILGSQRIW